MEEISSIQSDATQYLTFRLGDEDYGWRHTRVQENKGYVPTTAIPNAPEHVLGVLNLRGTIVPLIDLRSKFSLEKIERNQFNAIVVVVVRDRTIGIVVNSVSAVITVERASIQPVPDFASGPSNLVHGMVKMEESLTILLDIEAVLSDELSVAALAA